MSKLGKRLLQAAREGRSIARKPRTLDEVIDSLPAKHRANVKARTRALIEKARRKNRG
jgi:hypothetical protein